MLLLTQLLVLVKSVRMGVLLAGALETAFHVIRDTIMIQLTPHAKNVFKIVLSVSQPHNVLNVIQITTIEQNQILVSSNV